MQQDQLGKSFGLVIAFLVPGMIGLYAASLHVPMLQEWFDAAGRAQTTVGGFLFIIIASSGAGVFISGVRWYLLEELIKRAAGVSTEHEAVNRRDTQTELVYQNVRQHHYDYYLFYSNALVALVVLWVSWLPSQLPVLTAWLLSWAAAKPIIGTVLGAAAGWVLYASAVDAYGRYQKKRAAVLEITPKARESA